MSKQKNITISMIRGGETAAHTRIYRLYSLCLWQEGDIDHMAQEIITPDTSRHRFHCRRILAHKREIAGLLMRTACERSLRSRGDGCYWVSLISPEDSFPMRPSSPTICLLAMGLATGYITEEPYETIGLQDTITKVVVEDVRIRNTIGGRCGSYKPRAASEE